MKYSLIPVYIFITMLLVGCASVENNAQPDDEDTERGNAVRIHVDFRIKTLEWLVGFKKPINEMTLDDIQQLNKDTYSPIVSRIFFGKYYKLPKVTDQTIEGENGVIPVRLYYPSVKQNLTMIVFFHGGGWVIGSLNMYDRMCRRISHETGSLVMSVDYRLAPWHKFPDAVEDCYDAVLWAAENAARLGADSGRLMVMGDSAGGNLAAVVCLMARDMAGPSINRQVLIYPATDMSMNQPSIDRLADAPMLTKKMMLYFRQHYIRSEQDVQNPYCSPLFADDFTNLPPALIITAQYDPLHDDGLHYAQRLLQSGNSAQLLDYPGMVHGFMMFPGFCRGANPAFNKIAAFINK